MKVTEGRAAEEFFGEGRLFNDAAEDLLRFLEELWWDLGCHSGAGGKVP